MTPFNRDYELSQQYQRDRQHQADKHRMAQHARRSQSKRRLQVARLYKPVLFWLGQKLESFGNILQIRYGDLKPSPTD